MLVTLETFHFPNVLVERWCIVKQSMCMDFIHVTLGSYNPISNDLIEVFCAKKHTIDVCYRSLGVTFRISVCIKIIVINIVYPKMAISHSLHIHKRFRVYKLLVLHVEPFYKPFIADPKQQNTTGGPLLLLLLLPMMSNGRILNHYYEWLNT
jgi:hypothetical protein